MIVLVQQRGVHRPQMNRALGGGATTRYRRNGAHVLNKHGIAGEHLLIVPARNKYTVPGINPVPGINLGINQGYGSEPASTDIGPEGGDKLVRWTAATINQMFGEGS